MTTGIFFRCSLPEEIGWAEGLSAIALLLYRETAVISTVDRDRAWCDEDKAASFVIPSEVEGSLTISVRCLPLVPKLQLGNALVFEAVLRQRGVEMRSRYLIHHPGRAHFVTSTIVEWLPVFTSSACCDILVNSLQHCRKHKNLKIYAWVIMDNHFHAILAAPDLSAVLRDLKSFTAHEILKQLAEERREWLLNRLHYRRAAHKPTEHQVWQEGSHPQVIHDDATMLQKLEYLHNNPVKRGWVAAPEYWRYSSAHEWLGGAQPLLRCDEWL